MHTVRLLLKTTEYDEMIIAKRFNALAHVHNVLVKHAKKLLRKLNNNQEYKELLSEYCKLLKKEELSDSEKKLKRQISLKLTTITKELGLSEYEFQSYIKLCGKQFSKRLSSQQIQKETSRVWAGVKKVLYEDGKSIHFKKYRNFNTIGGKTNTNGVKFNKEINSIEWIGLNIKCKIPKNNDYILEALDSDISYCELERKMFPNGWHYYVVIYLKGDAPKKLTNTNTSGACAGIDIGTSTVAATSDNKLFLRELAPDYKKYNKKIVKLQKSLEISKRASNPDKYNSDGTINKKNKDKWVFSKNYRKKRNQLKSLYRQKSAYIKQFHETLINELLCESNTFIIETMSFKGLQARSKKTERSDHTTQIKQKDGSTKEIRKYKKRKRYGKSLNNRAPALFVERLKQKAELYGGEVLFLNTQEFKASQYNHIDDTYIKHKLSDRFIKIGNYIVQRDLYSSFLIKNTNNTLDKPDRDKCLYEFDKFIKMHNDLINEMKQQNISMKQCFGF